MPPKQPTIASLFLSLLLCELILSATYFLQLFSFVLLLNVTDTGLDYILLSVDFSFPESHRTEPFYNSRKAYVKSFPGSKTWKQLCGNPHYMEAQESLTKADHHRVPHFLSTLTSAD